MAQVKVEGAEKIAADFIRSKVPFIRDTKAAVSYALSVTVAKLKEVGD